MSESFVRRCPCFSCPPLSSCVGGGLEEEGDFPILDAIGETAFFLVLDTAFNWGTLLDLMESSRCRGGLEAV